MTNAIESIYSGTDPDVLFVVTTISDAMRRGVRHFKLDGTPLGQLNDVIDALVDDGEVLVDPSGSLDTPGH